MSAPWDEWDWDYVLHALGGAAITAPFVVLMALLSGPWWVPSLVMPIVTGGGVLRELGQHEWSWSEMTAHRWLEGLLWGAGSLVAALLGLIWLA